MSKTTFVHLWDTPNVGDQWCSPQSYFDFGNKQTQSFGETLRPADTVIYGGGQVFGRVAASVRQHAAAVHRKIIWGVGIDARIANSAKFARVARACALIGSRNKGITGCDWVPCVSAMATGFDAPKPPKHSAVLFYHATKSDDLPRVSGMPQMSNHGCTMAQALAFISSGETVITNSFHGTYWAMCLGRKVLCVPFSDKFSGFAENPVMAKPDDWHKAVDRAERRLGTLETARARNIAFYEKVVDLL